MSLAAVLMILIPPPVPPAPWRPERFPEYEAKCHAVDQRGNLLVGALAVAGQGDQRAVKLTLELRAALETTFQGRATAMVANPVTDGTYSFTDYLSFEANSQPFGVELESLGPKPGTIVLTIRGRPKSPVFFEPAEVGLCTATRVTEGSRFVPEPEIREQSQ